MISYLISYFRKASTPANPLCASIRRELLRNKSEDQPSLVLLAPKKIYQNFNRKILFSYDCRKIHYLSFHCSRTIHLSYDCRKIYQMSYQLACNCRNIYHISYDCSKILYMYPLIEAWTINCPIIAERYFIVPAIAASYIICPIIVTRFIMIPAITAR